MVLWNTSLPSSWSAGFLNKVTVSCPNISPLDLLTCTVRRTGLDEVTWCQGNLICVQFSSLAQLCPTLCNPIDCSLSGSSVYEIFQWSGDTLLVQLVKNPPANAGDPGLISGLEQFPGEGIGYPLQYSWASLVAQMVKYLPAIQET